MRHSHRLLYVVLCLSKLAHLARLCSCCQTPGCVQVLGPPTPPPAPALDPAPQPPAGCPPADQQAAPFHPPPVLPQPGAPPQRRHSTAGHPRTAVRQVRPLQAVRRPPPRLRRLAGTGGRRDCWRRVTRHVWPWAGSLDPPTRPACCATSATGRTRAARRIGHVARWWLAQPTTRCISLMRSRAYESGRSTTSRVGTQSESMGGGERGARDQAGQRVDANNRAHVTQLTAPGGPISNCTAHVHRPVTQVGHVRGLLPRRQDRVRGHGLQAVDVAGRQHTWHGNGGALRAHLAGGLHSAAAGGNGLAVGASGPGRAPAHLVVCMGFRGRCRVADTCIRWSVSGHQSCPRRFVPHRPCNNGITNTKNTVPQVSLELAPSLNPLRSLRAAPSHHPMRLGQ